MLLASRGPCLQRSSVAEKFGGDPSPVAVERQRATVPRELCLSCATTSPEVTSPEGRRRDEAAILEALLLMLLKRPLNDRSWRL